MDVHAASSRRRGNWLKQALCSLGALAALFGVGAAPDAAKAEGADFRPAAAVPESWRAFAVQLQNRFQERLASDDADVRLLQDYFSRRAANSGAGDVALTARTWILSDGRIELIEFDGLDDSEIKLRLRSVLARGNVGAPPADMLQPVHLRLSLRPHDRQEK